MSKNQNLKKAAHVLFPLLLVAAILIFNRTNTRPEIVKAGGGGDGLYTAKNAPFEIRFGEKDNPGKVTFKKENSSISFTLPEKEIEWKTENGNLIADTGNLAYTYTLIKNGGQARGVKEDIVLKKPTGQSEFKFSIQMENLKYSKNEADGLWHFYNSDGKDLFFIPLPYMEDASGERSENVEIEITDNTFKVKADENWLNSPERKYPITIDPGLRLSIITVHSHPQEGDNWVVDFETEGQADLRIIPDDQATIDDLDFVSLTCDGKDMEAQIQAGVIIYSPNWQCQGTGTVTHLVNVAAPHRLKFDFGGEIAYAYNAPGSTTYTLDTFEIKLSRPQPEALNVNWWIVN